MFASHAPTSGDAGCPRRAPAGCRPTPAGATRPAVHSSGPLRRPRRGLETFPAPAPTPSFPVGASWPRSRVSARSYPNSRLSQPSPRRSPSGSEKPRENLGAESRARSFGTPGFGKDRGQLATRRDPAAFRYLLACGGVPEQPASPGAVSPRSCPCWLLSRSPCTGDGGRPATPRCCPEPRRPRVNGSRSPTSGSPGISPGARAARRRLRHKLCGPGEKEVARPGGPATVPARDQPAGGAEGGGGHRRSYSGLARGSQLGPAPQSLSVTYLTPPRPNPVPVLPLGMPVPPPPAVPGAHVT